MEDLNDTYTRWRFLYENPAVGRGGWLPPAREVPELADLREEHQRLLASHSEANGKATALVAQRKAEEEARRAAQEREFLGAGPAGKLPKLTVTEDAVREARVRAEAAQDAMQTFVRTAITQIRERAPELRVGFDKVRAEADEKRAAAQGLLAEADRIEVSTRRLDAWLARFDGRSHLGYIAWADLPDPVEPATPTLEELHAAEHPPMGEVIPLESGSPAFGTDNPDDLDPDDSAARPWEVAINE